ncbi:MAG: membrane protein of unknown function [Promethearchaeota archaeon]|nr:MAG: membrane protein of unknown function [Candidatus Lokiarchaeota archaeon]
MKFYQIAKHNFLNNKKGILLYSFLLALLYFWFLSIFNPDSNIGMQQSITNSSELLYSFLNIENEVSVFLGFLNYYLFSFAWLYIGLYFTIKISQDVPTEVEEKTINLILSKPLKRYEFVSGKFLSYIFSNLVIISALFLALISGIIVFPLITISQIEFSAILLSLILLSLHLLSIGVTALAFSTFLNRRKSLTINFLVLIAFFILGQLYILFPEEIQWIKYFSIFHYYNTSSLLLNTTLDFLALDILALSLYSIVLFIISLIIFQNQNIPV